MALLDEAEYRRGRANGEAALAGARAQRDAGVHQWACFNCERAAQLVLKAILHGIGAGPWGHDLLDLANKARDEGVDVPAEIDEALWRHDRYYIQTRYPDAYASGDVATRCRRTEADQAVNDAESVLEWADQAWTSVQ
jgi:HEPN domain-containing protein